MTTAERKKLEDEARKKREALYRDIRKQKEAEARLAQTPLAKRESIASPEAAAERLGAKAANQAVTERLQAQEQERQDKIKREREEQAKYAAKPKLSVTEEMQQRVVPPGITVKPTAASKTPAVADINRAAANVDYSWERRQARENYAVNEDLTPLQRFERSAQKYNPLALSDMAINKAGAGIAQFGAALGDAVVSPLKGSGAVYPTAQTTKELWSKQEPGNAVNDYISNARKTLGTVQAARTDYYLNGGTLQDKADSYTAKLDAKFANLTDTSVTKALSDLSQSIGYMVPVQIANMILPNAGTALLFASGYASGERQALQAGGTPEEAKAYAYLNGLNQSLGEMLVGGVLGKGAGAIDTLLKKSGVDIASKIANPTIKAWANAIVRALGEGAEEVIQGLIDVAAQRATYNPDAAVSGKELAYEGLLGGLMGGVYGAPGMVSEYNALRLPSAQAETQPAKATFAERNRNDLSRINADLNANLPTITENAAQAQKTGAQASSAQDYYNSRIADIKSRETDLFGRLRTAEEDETFNRLTTAKNNTEKSGILAGASDEVIAAVSRTAEAGGIDILFFNEGRTESGNIVDGYEFGGKLYINSQSPRAIEFIQGHELTHSIEKAKSYDKLSKYVLNRMGTDAVAAERQRIGGIRTAEGQQLTEAEIDREIVADFAGKNLLNNEADIIDIVRTDRTLAERIRDWLGGMVKRFTGTAEEKFYSRAKALYVKALAEARRSDTVRADAVMASVSEDIKSDNFKKWFGDSKVKNEDGSPKIVYHGTNADENFTMFDTYGSKYGLYGMGSYFTEDKDIAWKYTKKGRGGNPRVYETYLNIRNPLDMDAPADITAWEKAINKADIDANLSGVKTNSDVIRLIERDLTDNEYFAWEGADIMTGIIQGMGYDGITHIGGNIRGDKEHRVWIAYEPEQIKSADPVTYDDNGNVIPLSRRFNPANPDIRYSVSNDYFRKRANATKAINATTQDADTWQAPPKTRRAVPIEATITADERAGEAALTAHKTLQQIIDEIDSRYEQQAEIATQQAREHLDRIIEQENAKHIEIPGVPVSETAEAEAAEARELTLPYVMADEDAKDNVKKVSAEENQSIALITEAEALLKPADPLQADMEAYKKAKKDYRATVQGNKTNPGMVTDADVLASAEQVSKARDNVLKKIEKREAAMKHALDNGTFAEVMLKQYEQLKQMKKAARNTKNPEAQAKAQKQAEQKQAYIFDINRRRKALLYKQAEETMGPLEAWTDKSIGLKYQRETFERNIRDIAPNKTIAERVNKEYRWVIDKNEAKRNKYRQDYNERVKALNMSDKVLPGNEVSERYAVQFVGEADYLIYISTAKKDRFAKTRADYQQDLNDFMAKNPNFNYEAIREKVKTMRGIYNAIYIDINKARVENGYEPVEYRKGYFPHFSEHKPDTLLSKLAATFGINTAPDSLPTSINGLTYQFRPGTRWFGNILRRSSNTTDYDAVKGFDRYILGASDVIFHTEDIQRLRAMSNYIREYGSDKRLQDQAKLIRADDTKTAEQQQEAIASLFREANHVLGNFVVDLDEYTNQLANKKPRKDRDTEYDFGRKAYNILQSVENRIAGNMVAVNPRTWLTNFIPIHQAAARISNKNMIYGALSAVKATIESDALSDASDFLVNRRGVDPLVMSFSQKAGDVLSKPMTWIDNYAAETIVRARYLDNMEKGMPHANAIDEAGAFATGIMAGRSKGAAPTLFSAKNPATKVFTMFQLEVNNQLSALLKDLPDEKRDEGVAALAMAFIKFIVGAYLFNDLFEWIIGARPGLDVAGVANEAVGDFTGYQLPNTFEFAADLIKERRLPELADFETTKKTTNAAGISTAKNIAEELPFIGGVLGGGRVPISAAGFDLGKIWSAGSGIKDGTVDSNKALATIGKELSNPLFYLALPFGGGQIKKIYQGVDAVNQGGSWTLDSDGDRVLQYPVFDKNPLTYARAALFGKTSLPTAQDWIDNDFKRLSASASATYAALTNMKQDPEEAYNAVMDIAKSEKTDTQSKASIQRNKIAGYPIAGSMKYEMYYNMVASDSDKRIMDELTKANLNEGAAFSVIDKYKDLNESKAKAGEKALDWQHWVDKQGFTDKQKSIIDENIGFRVAMPVEPSTYEKLTASGMEADAAYQIAEAFNKLKPLEGETGVSEYQKYHAINEMDLEQKVKLAAYRAIMEKERYMKLADAVIAGTPLKLYIEYIDKVRGIKSDLQDGETVPDSKKQKVLSYINFLPITKKAKDKLYEQAGYRESTISDAPWRGGAKYSGDMFGLKVNGRQLG